MPFITWQLYSGYKMLEQLLAEIRKGGTLTPQLLALRLGMGVEMVQAMLERLAQMGLVKAYEAPCVTCEGCALKAGCSAGGRKPVLWTTTF